MPVKKRYTKRRTKKRVSVAVIVAVITATGGIIAAVIGIYPQLTEGVNTTNNTPNENQKSYNKYDDPLGLFSIEYPSEYAVASREILSKELWVSFFHNEPLDPDAPWGATGAIYVRITAEEVPFNDYSQIYDYTVQGFIKNNFPSDVTSGFEGKTKLISSEQKEDGLFMHIQIVTSQQPAPREVTIDAYTLYKFEKSAWVMVLYLIGHDSFDAYRDRMDYTFSSFSWSPQKVVQFFNQ